MHDDVMKWKHFLRYWPFVGGIHRSPVNSPHKGQWRGALMLSLICVWINGWVNNSEAGDLRRHRPLWRHRNGVSPWKPMEVISHMGFHYLLQSLHTRHGVCLMIMMNPLGLELKTHHHEIINWTNFTSYTVYFLILFVIQGLIHCLVRNYDHGNVPAITKNHVYVNSLFPQSWYSYTWDTGLLIVDVCDVIYQRYRGMTWWMIKPANIHFYNELSIMSLTQGPSRAYKTSQELCTRLTSCGMAFLSVRLRPI